MLFWWAPTEGFKRLPISLLIIALFVVGFEFLRRQAVREFPDETWEQGSGALAPALRWPRKPARLTAATVEPPASSSAVTFVGHATVELDARRQPGC